MNYKSFEDLPVWQAAIEFAHKIFEFTGKADFRAVGDIKNQLERAAVSISNNIAEGFERGTNAELINFLYIARGSAGESRSMLCLCERLKKDREDWLAFKRELEESQRINIERARQNQQPEFDKE